MRRPVGNRRVSPPSVGLAQQAPAVGRLRKAGQDARVTPSVVRRIMAPGHAATRTKIASSWTQQSIPAKTAEPRQPKPGTGLLEPRVQRRSFLPSYKISATSILNSLWSPALETPPPASLQDPSCDSLVHTLLQAVQHKHAAIGVDAARSRCHSRPEAYVRPPTSGSAPSPNSLSAAASSRADPWSASRCIPASCRQPSAP